MLPMQQGWLQPTAPPLPSGQTCTLAAAAGDSLVQEAGKTPSPLLTL